MPLARTLRLALFLTALLSFSSPPARAAWQPQGNPVCTAAGTQQQVSGCPDGSGGIYLVWADPRAGAAQVYAQHLFANGSIAPGWPAGGLQVTSGALAQLPAALPDGSGGLLVIAQVGSSLVAQRVDPSGAIAPGFPAGGIVLTSDLLNGNFAAAPDGAGGAWVLRAGTPAVDGSTRVRLTRVSRDGTFRAGWTAGGITLVLGVYSFARVQVEADLAGGAVTTVKYYSFATAQNVALFTRVRANGTIAQNQNAPTYLSNGSPPGIGTAVAVPDGHAGMLALWSDESASAETAFFGTRWDSSAVAIWPPALNLGGPPYSAAAPFHESADGSGGAYFIGPSYSSFGTFAWRRLPNGSTAPGWSDSGLLLSSFSDFATLLALPAGVLTFWSERPSNPYVLRALLLTPGGSPAMGWASGGNAVCTLPVNRTSPILIPDGLGGAIGCWLDLRDEATSGQDVYATRLVEPPPPVATDAALVEASAETDRVHLRWWSADGPRFGATLERESGGAGWSPRAELRADAAGTIDYEDDDVEAGTTYGYRLAITEDGQRRVVGATTIHVPGATSFSIEPVRPNPSAGDYAVAFSLPDARAATIDVIDLAGRVVRSEAFAPGHAGRFVLRRAFTGAPGVYLVRLTQGGVSRTTRLVHAE